MPAPFLTSRLVEFHDTDMAGIMHFASFFIYMESVEHEMLRSLGLSVHARLENDNVTFPRVSATCNYVSPARSEEILDIAVSVARIGTKSVTYDFRFTRDGAKIATGSMTAVFCRFGEGERPVSQPIPADIVAKLKTYAA